jgi:hypothetical protein
MGRKHRLHELFQSLSQDDQLTLLHVGESLLIEAPFAVAYDGRFVVNVGGPHEKHDAQRAAFFKAVVHLCRSEANGATWALEVGPELPFDHEPPGVVQ